MKPRLTRDNLSRWAQMALLGIALMLTALLAVRWFGAGPDHGVVEAARSGDTPGPATEDESQPRARHQDDRWSKMTTAINEHNPFVPEKSPPTVTGILGDKVMLSNGRSATAGQTVGKMKILEIGGDWVRVKVEGREKKMYVFGQSSGVRVTSEPSSPSSTNKPPSNQHRPRERNRNQARPRNWPRPRHRRRRP